MSVYFTICSNNYLAFAGVLYKTLKQHQPGAVFYLFLCDEKVADIDYTSFADEVVVLSSIEERFMELASRYNIIELNTCVKPRAFEYLFEKGVKKAIYLDPDIGVFSSLNSIEEALEIDDILLTPHIYTPMPFDGKKPDESNFLNFGIYNLGFIGLKAGEEVFQLLRWWKNWTYEKGYIDVYNGIFVDQLPMNHVPIFFNGVRVLFDIGMNMAPWNLHERILTTTGQQFYVNDSTLLKFYHFSSFAVDKFELPVHRYTRFSLKDRTDLTELYKIYNELVKAAGYFQTTGIQNAYEPLRQATIRKKKKEKWVNRILFRKRR